MATLKELMGDLTRGDGRRFFDLTSRIIYEPIYMVDGLWYGLSSKGTSFCFEENGFPTWEIDKPAKLKKNVKMYRPIFCKDDSYRLGEWRSFKTIGSFDAPQMVYGKDLIGWQEMEIEVDE